MSYTHLEEVHNTRSAEIVLPILFEHIKPKSVLDVGCGLGTWLKVCRDLGVEEILGIDGEYVEMTKVVIPRDFFLHHDLRNLSKLNFQRKFDLAICLEVAEHLPKDCADSLVSFLSSTSDMILFSAAIPHQGGQGHINEQPLSYWLEKFERQGFKPFDFIRPMIWNNKNVDWWYKQNIIMLSKKDNPFANMNVSFYCHTLVHPDLYMGKISILSNLIDRLGLKRSNMDSESYIWPSGFIQKVNFVLRLFLKQLNKAI